MLERPGGGFGGSLEVLEGGSVVSGAPLGVTGEGSGLAGGVQTRSPDDAGVGPAERGGPGGGGGGYASRRRRNRLLPKDAQYPLGTADLKG